MAKQVYNEQIQKLQEKLARLQAERAEQEKSEQEAKKREHEFAKFVVDTVAQRVGNNAGFSGEPIILINAEKLNSSFGGEILEVLNGYNIQGVEYIACNKYSRFGEFIATALLLKEDVFIKDGQLYINDIYTVKSGAIPHHYKKFNNVLRDGTEVHDLRTYDASAKWAELEEKRRAKNAKLSERANNI